MCDKPWELNELEEALRLLKRGFVTAGVPGSLLRAVETRALRSGRRQTGLHRSNRESRWRLQADDPQYGSELDCKLVLAKLLAEFLDFEDAPKVSPEVVKTAAKFLGHEPKAGTYRDPLTRERLSYPQMATESGQPRHGISSFHIGHDNPRLQPRHTPTNVNWRSSRSNDIQGDLTLTEARTKFVELIARYFELGEVRVEPDRN